MGMTTRLAVTLHSLPTCLPIGGVNTQYTTDGWNGHNAVHDIEARGGGQVEGVPEPAPPESHHNPPPEPINSISTRNSP